MPTAGTSGTVLGHSGMLLGGEAWPILALLIGAAACVVIGIGIGMLVKAPQKLPFFAGHRPGKKKRSRR